MTQPRHGRIVPQRSSRLRHGRMSPAPTAHTRQRMAWDASKATAHANQCISGSRLGANHAESAALNGPCAALNTRSIPRPSSPVSVSLRRCRCPDATTPQNGPHSSDRTGRRRSGHDLRSFVKQTHTTPIARACRAPLSKSPRTIPWSASSRNPIPRHKTRLRCTRKSELLARPYCRTGWQALLNERKRATPVSIRTPSVSPGESSQTSIPVLRACLRRSTSMWSVSGTLEKSSATSQ